MASDKKTIGFEKQNVDEDYLLNVISGDEQAVSSNAKKPKESLVEIKPKDKVRNSISKKVDFEETFLVNRFPSGRNGKVVYIRSEYHERLLRIVQLTRAEKTTLYSYIDNILEQHFMEYGEDITNYFNQRFKPIL